MAWEAWLYGSLARGDADAHSDVDVLVAGDVAAAPVELRKCFPSNTSFAVYGWRRLGEMAEEGSLFLHHLRMEGRPLVSTGTDFRLEALLDGLPPYRRVGHDTAMFSEVLDDVERSLNEAGDPTFEAAILAAVLRHGSILGCYLLGRPTFGRTAAFEELVRQVRLPDPPEEFSELYKFRLQETRGEYPEKRASVADARKALGFARQVIREVENLAINP